MRNVIRSHHHARWIRPREEGLRREIGICLGHGIQAGYVGLVTITRIHMNPLNPPMQIRLSSIYRLSRSSVQKAKSWGLLPQ